MKSRFKFIFGLCLVLVLSVAGVLPAAHAQSGNTWTIAYYNNQYLAGNPTQVLTAPYISFNWGTAPPAQNMPADYWSARMTSTAFFYGGVYRFTITADDGFTLRLNNAVYLNTIDTPQPGKTFTVDVPMYNGYSQVQVDYRQLTATAYISVNWQYVSSSYPSYPAGVVPPPVPMPTLTPVPPQNVNVVTQYGDYTRCAQNGLHQAECFVSTGQWNSPDIGSIRMEPQIVLWGNCTPGATVTQSVAPGQKAVKTECSKTGAGYFVA